ncbi:hypothetical protein [uncultured Flavobacterium sp.]|uniref:hypothetical protein n=1 Tax=uncultured Flavobacterium sp. TaxID=165435 RepID=UPI0025D722A3|nr:hypothetical protein [uncultured Flavobacterium sp.]
MESTNRIQTLKPTYHLLKFTFAIVPIVAGLDKFTNLLANWENYISPSLKPLIPFDGGTFMGIVGIIEIIAGIIVLKNAEIGSYIVAAWLALIALTLIAGGSYLDVAVRDLVMAIAAFSTARIAKIAE